MFSVFFILFGGIAIASSFGSDEVIEDEQDYIPDHEVEVGEPGSLLQIDNEESDVPTIREIPGEIEASEGEQDKHEVGEIANSEYDSGADFDDVIEIGANSELYLSTEDLSNLPSALADWELEDNVLQIELGDQNTITLVMPDGVSGSLIVMDADYIETTSDGDGESITENCGSNIYFVPEGETFPENYEWSAEGATLVDVDDYENNAADFGGIRLFARIDCGSWTIQHQDGLNQEITHDSRMGDPTIYSNVSIQFL